jgi:hypothetical protein
MNTKISQLYLIVVLSIVTFRIVIPTALGPIPVSILVTSFYLLNLIRCKYLSINKTRLFLFTFFFIIVAISNLVNIKSVGSSLASGLLLFSLWIFSIFEKKKPSEDQGAIQLLQHKYLKVILFSSYFAIIQGTFGLFFQIWVDPVSLIPKQFQLDGFNTTYAMVFGTNWNRANGGIFPEPSYYSLFAGLALVFLYSRNVYSTLKYPNLMATAISLGILFSGAISALMFLPIIIIQIIMILLVSKDRRKKYTVYSILVIPIFVLSVPNVRDEFLRKLSSNLLATNSDSSLAARISRPYSYWLDAVSSSPLLGYGSGTAADILRSYSNYLVNTPSIVKISLDYGMLGLFVFSMILISISSQSCMSVPEKIALFLFFVVPTDGMYIAAVSYLIIIVFLVSKKAENTSKVSRTTSKSKSPGIYAPNNFE